ncbi:ubiquitin ligase (cullin) of SCF [Neonectria magnoliae]|uniref:Ubiquitin ligase (Cullin) of SCF n=1 Tax=Neonectria magnoliae TaxID=2732573 RepID=A0ABR1IGI6_9HYPO
MATKMATPSQMPPIPNREDIGATWTYLQAGISRIMNDLEQGIDMQMYMGVYTYVVPRPSGPFITSPMLT